MFIIIKEENKKEKTDKYYIAESFQFVEDETLTFTDYETQSFHFWKMKKEKDKNDEKKEIYKMKDSNIEFYKNFSTFEEAKKFKENKERKG